MTGRIVFACAAVLSLFALVSSQPFPIAVRGDNKCLDPNIEPALPDYPASMSVLLDSFHFKDLLEDEGGDWESTGSVSSQRKGCIIIVGTHTRVYTHKSSQHCILYNSLSVARWIRRHLPANNVGLQCYLWKR